MSIPKAEPAARKPDEKKLAPKGVNDGLLATGGGSAPAGGVPFQGSLGAFFAVSGFAPCKIDERLELGNELVVRFRFET